MTQSTPRRPQRRSRIAATIKALVRTRVTTGLLVFLPIYVTYLLIRVVFEVLSDASRWILDYFLHVDQRSEYVQWTVAIASVILTLTLLYGIGLFAANLAGRRILELFEMLVDRVPVVKTIYRASKQLLTTLGGDQTANFQRVAWTPFMSPTVRTIGFITNIIVDPETQEEICTIFVPTTPNPTSGFMLMVRRKDVVELDWSVEEAFRTILSCGILMPEPLRFTPLPSNPALPAGSSSPVNSPS